MNIMNTPPSVYHLSQGNERIASNAPFYSSLFTDALFRREASESSADPLIGEIVLAVDMPTVLPLQSVFLVGSSPELGAWDIDKAVALCDADFPTWRTPPMPLTSSLIASEFKIVVADKGTRHNIYWEKGANRNFSSVPIYAHRSLCLQLSAPDIDLPAWKGAGVAIPLFSIRSQQSAGIGDFRDLKRMVDWAVLAGQKMIQILPINDTTMSRTWKDSYPYNANSIFALHPQYIAPLAVGILKDKEAQQRYETEAKRLNCLAEVDYEAVNILKETYMRQLYMEAGQHAHASNSFRSFMEENKTWLEPYALFSLLRDKYHSVEFADWGDEAVFSEELLQDYRAKHAAQLGYYFFVQYHLHLQLLEAREYAHSRGVVFKGDIPIGVSRTSVDVWVNPSLFRLNAQAGAPPDAFSVLGQNWGFPTYNWEEMEKDNYAWWNARFKKMATYFDAYRIDHILGFFRIWEIPLEAVHGLLGYFSPAQPFSEEELRNTFGFPFEQRLTKPAVNDWILGKLFKEKAEEVCETFFHRAEDGSITFKEKYDTQLKVSQEVSDKALCEPLLSLFDEVLFIPDPYNEGFYHPRIAAQSTSIYRALSPEDQECFDHLYAHFFYHRHDVFWQREAMQKLPSLTAATPMLTCGEDLGMIPHCVPLVMEQLQILSLEIQRMPKNEHVCFEHPNNYPYRSVCTTSTHDMPPLRAWLLEDKEQTKSFLAEMLDQHSVEIGDDIPAWICEAVIDQHVYSPAMWCILPLQDWLSMDEKARCTDPHAERINIPANSRHYWRYRMHLTVEDLIANTSLNDHIKGKVASSNRL